MIRSARRIVRGRPGSSEREGSGEIDKAGSEEEWYHGIGALDALARSAVDTGEADADSGYGRSKTGIGMLPQSTGPKGSTSGANGQLSPFTSHPLRYVRRMNRL